MKRVIFLSLIFLTQVVNAQPYESMFGKNSTWWITEWYNLDFGGDDTIYVQKDTTVNGLTWKKLDCRLWGGYSTVIAREDTLTGKVWTKSFWCDTTTYLAFDFSLQKGDTFDINGIMSNGSVIPPRIVDSIYFVNGRKYIRFGHSAMLGSEDLTFIEGVGGIWGIDYKRKCNMMWWPYLLCSYKDGVQTYANKKYGGNCDIEVTSIDHIDILSPKVYPNPFSRWIKVEIKGITGPAKIELLNSTGQVVYKSSLQAITFLPELPKGIYFLRVLNRRGLLFQKAVVKQ